MTRCRASPFLHGGQVPWWISQVGVDHDSTMKAYRLLRSIADAGLAAGPSAGPTTQEQVRPYSQQVFAGQSGGGPGASRVLLGKVAVVTGGGRGLGREVARRLAAEGAHVAVAARSEDELRETVALITGAGGRASAFTVDVSDSSAVEQLVVAVEFQAGPVDLLVNNAAVIWPLGPAWEVSTREWWRLLEINLFGTFLCAHAVLPGMTRRGSGRIVNVASGAGIQAPPFGSAYAASKAAVIRLSEELALETKAHGVAVFSIDPGWMSTAMTAYLADSDQGRRWTPWAASRSGPEAQVSPARAADLVVRLASGGADALSGRYLTVWDDVDDLISRADEIIRDDLYTVRLRK
jgi:NAD(P)-dependent dehydrogenase (short-subunit alcohol dehydrogenase family)